MHAHLVQCTCAHRPAPHPAAKSVHSPAAILPRHPPPYHFATAPARVLAPATLTRPPPCRLPCRRTNRSQAEAAVSATSMPVLQDDDDRHRRSRPRRPPGVAEVWAQPGRSRVHQHTGNASRAFGWALCHPYACSDIYIYIEPKHNNTVFSHGVPPCAAIPPL